MYVIHQLGSQYWKKLYLRSWLLKTKGKVSSNMDWPMLLNKGSSWLKKPIAATVGQVDSLKK